MEVGKIRSNSVESQNKKLLCTFLFCDMGLSFSTRQDLYTHHFTNPRVSEISQEFHYRLIASAGESHFKFPNGKEFINPFPNLVSDKDMFQHIFVTNISLLFLDNETKFDTICQIEGLFGNSAESNEDVKHTDESGKFSILCPANYAGTVKGNDSILYKPRLKDEILKTYAGIAEAIVNPGELLADSYEITHPLCYFIVNNEHLLEPLPGDIEKVGETLYKFDGKFVERVREYFRNTIYNDMHATRFDEAKISMKIPPELQDELRKSKNSPNVTIIVRLAGLLVSSGELRLKNVETHFA